MQNKKVIALIVLSIVAVISLTYGIGVSPKSGVKKATIATIGSLQQASSQAPISTQRRAKRSKFTSWKRNPFVPIGVTAASSGLVLSGILSYGKGLKATIGDAIVGKGDKIGDNTVVDIQKDRVILNDGTKNFELILKE